MLPTLLLADICLTLPVFLPLSVIFKLVLGVLLGVVVDVGDQPTNLFCISVRRQALDRHYFSKCVFGDSVFYTQP